MNIDEQWKHIEQVHDTDLSSMLQMKIISKLPSKDPVEKIKKNLLTHSIWGVIVSIFYIALLIAFPFWQIILCLGIVLLFTIWAITKSTQLFFKINNTTRSGTVLHQMESHYANIKQWMSINQKAGLIIYPISAAGGFMLGGFLGSGKPIEVIMTKPSMIIALLVAIVILLPCCFYLAKWMTKKSFGKYVDVLKQNIDTLKNEK